MSLCDAYYQDGYAEGRRTALHLVVALEDSAALLTADREIRRRLMFHHRAYWLGFKRALRLHYADAYRPNVLAARKRHAS